MVPMHSIISNTALICRNVTVSGRRTSIRMEQVMWNSLADICRTEERMLNELITMIDEKRAESNLTAAIRVFIICYYRDVAHSRMSGVKGFAETATFDDESFESEEQRPLEASRLLSGALDVVGDSPTSSR